MLRAFIVDDEPLARDELKYLLNQGKGVNILGESDCIDEAVQEIAHLKPDLVFLDIELDGENGLDLAHQIQDIEPTPFIVFATAYDEYALQAFESNAVDYILKPFDEVRINQTLDKIRKFHKINEEERESEPPQMKNHNEKIALPLDDRIVLLPKKDILYLEYCEGKCLIKTVKQEYKVHEALVEVEKKLQQHQFQRVHRSFIVNLDHILEIQPWFNSTYNLIMKDQSKVPVSRTYVKELKKVFGL